MRSNSNGFSLVRKVFSLREQKKAAVQLLRPTRIYVKEVLSVIGLYKINGIAHITGGAFYDKLTKILPEGKAFRINKDSWPVLNIFQKIQKKGKINDSEMFRTFNMGIGLVMVCSKKNVEGIRNKLLQLRMPSYVIGEVVKKTKGKIVFVSG